MGTLRMVQVGRAAVLPDRTRRAPWRVATLEGVRQRNTLLDAIFYDVGCIGHDEAVAIAPWLAAEGALLIVPPSGRGSLTLCPTLEDFVRAGGTAIHALAVAGVGSSALGSAAFARNVADALDEPVAAVVSGYGIADMLTEAMGGFFWFGALNSLRHLFETIDRVTETDDDAERALDDFSAPLVRTSRDTRTVLALLRDPRFEFDLLTGHSKGNLVIAEALYVLGTGDPARLDALATGTRIVTFSARIAMPDPFRGVVDVMGAWDWFGAINSRPDIRPDYVVPDAWHHTNTDLPACLAVTDALRTALSLRRT
jgi:hypothetical protein